MDENVAARYAALRQKLKKAGRQTRGRFSCLRKASKDQTYLALHPPGAAGAIGGNSGCKSSTFQQAAAFQDIKSLRDFFFLEMGLEVPNDFLKGSKEQESL
ncbi:MAG: hypothetical protein QHH75_15260 [Bacillota bacterium]|nr:hypothetical protein [Bacillota bacterium]